MYLPSIQFLLLRELNKGGLVCGAIRCLGGLYVYRECVVAIGRGLRVFEVSDGLKVWRQRGGANLRYGCT